MYMGKNHFFIEPALAYMYTTTGRLEYYEKDKEHSNNSYLLFKRGEYYFR